MLETVLALDDLSEHVRRHLGAIVAMRPDSLLVLSTGSFRCEAPIQLSH